ncbi:MAG: hypothetical protein HQ582_10450 [Planctomycetes bacterium]|nr:hypothetical protein [Planctomycetota bacterium]
MPRKKRPPQIKGRKLKAGERSLRFLRGQGYDAEVCEQFKARVEGRGQQAIFKGGFRKDLFGFMDILAYRALSTVAVQTTSRQQITAHLRKYRRDAKIKARILRWIACPNRGFIVHGWICVEVPCKSKAGTKAEWQVTERWVTAEDLEEPAF